MHTDLPLVCPIDMLKNVRQTIMRVASPVGLYGSGHLNTSQHSLFWALSLNPLRFVWVAGLGNVLFPDVRVLANAGSETLWSAVFKIVSYEQHSVPQQLNGKVDTRKRTGGAVRI